MEQEQVGENLGPVKNLASEQDESPAADFSPDELIDLSQDAPPPSDSGLREGDEELAGPSSEDLAFNDDDADSDPVAFDAVQSDVAGEVEVAQQVVKNLASTAKAAKATKATNGQLSRFLNAAKGQVGYRSRPGNPPFSKYGRWLGLAGGQGHYCAAFVSWCAARAGIGKKVGKSGRVQFFFDAYRKKGRFGSTPRVGSLVIFDWDRNGKVDHIGIVVGVGSGYIHTIEGNTGSPRGVYLQKRRTGSSIRGYCYPSFTQVIEPPIKTAKKVWHLVRKGETLSAISKKYDVSIAMLLARNQGKGTGQGKITNPNQILVNQRIRIR
jgi:nucleoid-associated protein YgaU